MTDLEKLLAENQILIQKIIAAAKKETSSGNIGIGTTNPKESLDIRSNININGILNISNYYKWYRYSKKHLKFLKPTSEPIEFKRRKAQVIALANRLKNE